MKVLFVGGTGILSSACTTRALEVGIDLVHLTRGQRPARAGVRAITADIADPARAAKALSCESWDAVVDFIAFTPQDVAARLAALRGRVGQYVFISSASAYQKPPQGGLITEDTPLENPYWDYARNKAAAEALLAGSGIPFTIVRPSLTYDDSIIPLAVGCWQKGYTLVERLRRGAPLIIPGDGLSLWTITHARDFARGVIGLLGNAGANNEAVTVTSDEALPWNRIYELTARAAGVTSPRFVHMASDFITACLPAMTGTLLGDKANSALFDTSKLKRLVPGFSANTPFAEGIARSVAWFDADPRRQVVDTEVSANWDRLIAAYERVLVAAKRDFGAA